MTDVADLLQDDQLEASHLWTQLNHQEVGELKYPLGIFDSEDFSPARSAAPLLGQDNGAIYGGELGLTSQEMAGLRSAQVI